MSWFFAALLATALLSVVNILDGHLLQKRFPSLKAFILPVGLLMVSYNLPLALVFPFAEGTPPDIILLAVTAGLLRAFSVYIMLFALKTEEVSRVIPIYYSYPIFVSLMAVPLLGESIGLLRWLAILAVVGGIILVSARRNGSGGSFFLGKTTGLLILAGLLISGSDIINKHVLDVITFWNGYWVSSICLAIVLLAVSFRRSVFTELKGITKPILCYLLIILDELVLFGGMLLLLWSIQHGPISLVSAISSARPLFVLVYAFLLVRLIPGFLLEWPAGRRLRILQIGGVILTVSGIAVMNLFS
ncbi:EamA family transporter [Dehalococcoides mccartyi]|uniref:EamA family transporter n=1 Tax=Dehalococcoides mccartyi TaxID=61435 RepID=UPI0008710A4C|nr:EamA family transporter [Dehalococcoides mccartyi]AOV99753.1 membrane protein [Dehalococcoides mccartyi]